MSRNTFHKHVTAPIFCGQTGLGKQWVGGGIVLFTSIQRTYATSISLWIVPQQMLIMGDRFIKYTNCKKKIFTNDTNSMHPLSKACQCSARTWHVITICLCNTKHPATYTLNQTRNKMPYLPLSPPTPLNLSLCLPWSPSAVMPPFPPSSHYHTLSPSVSP